MFQIEHWVHRLEDDALATSTKNRYQKGLKAWTSYQKHLKRVITDVTPQDLVGYTAFRYGMDTTSYQSLSVELSAIKAFTLTRWNYPTEQELLQLRYVKMGFKRNRPPNVERKGALPIQALVNYFQMLHSSQRTQFNKLLCRAVLSVAFRGMLRVGEYSVQRGEDTPSNTKTSRIDNILYKPSHKNPDSINLIWSSSKMNQYQQTEETMLICECESGVCGLHSLKSYLPQLSQHSYSTRIPFHSRKRIRTSRLNSQKVGQRGSQDDQPRPEILLQPLLTEWRGNRTTTTGLLSLSNRETREMGKRQQIPTTTVHTVTTDK
jgi:hypothetical protein